MCQIDKDNVLKVSSRSDDFYASYLRKTMRGPFDSPTSARVNIAPCFSGFKALLSLGVKRTLVIVIL